MKISTKGRYALRLMLDLAVNYSGSYIPLKIIAQRQEISDKYLEQIINILSKADFVQSARGAHGGYRLTRRPDEYTVGEILRLAEGSIAPVSCLDCNNICDKQDSCITLSLWKKMQLAIDEVVDNTTLQDLIDDFNQTHKCKRAEREE